MSSNDTNTATSQGTLLTDPSTGAAYLIPAGTGLPPGSREVLDVYGHRQLVAHEALEGCRLTPPQAEALASELLSDPAYRVVLMKEFNFQQDEQLTELQALLSAESPEAFAAALGGSPEGDLRALDARIRALEKRLTAAQASLQHAGADPEEPGPLPTTPVLARDPHDTPALLALFGTLLARARPSVALGFAPPPYQPPTVQVTVPQLPKFSYADLLGRDPHEPVKLPKLGGES